MAIECDAELSGLSLDWDTRRPKVTLTVDAAAEDLERLMGRKLRIRIGVLRKRRSPEANAYFYVLITKIAGAVGQSVPYVHNLMLRRYGQIELIDGKAVYLVLPDTEAAARDINGAETYHLRPTAEARPGRGGIMYRTYIMLRGSHTYSTAEMSRLIDGTVTEAKELGIETMTPKEIERMMSVYEEHHAG